MSKEMTSAQSADLANVQGQQVDFKSRMELMQDRMDDVLDKVISGKMDLPTAKAVNALFQTFINSANAETAFMQRTGQPLMKTAMTPCHATTKGIPNSVAVPGNEAPQPAQQIEATKHGVKHTMTRGNGITSMVHQIAG